MYMGRNFTVVRLMFNTRAWPFWMALTLENYCDGLRYTYRAGTRKSGSLEAMNIPSIRFKHDLLHHCHTYIQHSWTHTSSPLHSTLQCKTQRKILQITMYSQYGSTVLCCVVWIVHACNMQESMTCICIMHTTPKSE